MPGEQINLQLISHQNCITKRQKAANKGPDFIADFYLINLLFLWLNLSWFSSLQGSHMK